jgi:rhodanese-related sulfurtransferase
LSSALEPELEIGDEDAERALSADTAHLIDVREEWEFRRRRVPGATLVLLAQLPQRATSLPRDKRLLVICEHGNRSLAAAEYLRRVGFGDAVSVRGGTAAWAANDRPVEQG